MRVIGSRVAFSKLGKLDRATSIAQRTARQRIGGDSIKMQMANIKAHFTEHTARPEGTRERENDKEAD